VSEPDEHLGNCCICRFFNEHEDEIDGDGIMAGECRRYPPKRGGGLVSRFPACLEVDFCGEFRENHD